MFKRKREKQNKTQGKQAINLSSYQKGNEEQNNNKRKKNPRCVSQPGGEIHGEQTASH